MRSGCLRFRETLRPFIVAFVFTLAAWNASAAPDPIDVFAPMRDGTKLATTVYLPDGKGPFPTILVRTPYNKSGAKSIAGEATQRGYALAAQDCRGRFGSEGDYEPFKTDREDGFDAVQWCATQSWCDGNVGMWGGSAVGITSNMAAASAPPALKCAYVIVAPSSWRDESLYMGGVWRKEMIDGWMQAQGATEVRKNWERLAILDKYWEPYEITNAYDKIQVPIYNVAGWFDIFLKGGIANFRGIQAKGAGAAKGNQKLLIGALAHGQLTSDIKYPPGAGDTRGADMWRWFDHWLNGADNGIEKEPAVRYFLMGDCRGEGAPGNVWMTSDKWPPGGKQVSYYLHEGGALTLNAPADADSATTYDYDPKNPVQTVGGSNLVYAQKGPMDQSVIKDRADYLRFQTEVLAEPVTIAGPVSVELYATTDGPDTDFMAKLVDLYPDGYEALLQDGAIRVRWREWYDVEPMMQPGEVAVLEIDLWSTANVFNKGHRIGVHITSSNDPRFDPNPNTGTAFRSGGETRVARNTVFHDSYRPSRLKAHVVGLGELTKAE